MSLCQARELDSVETDSISPADSAETISREAVHAQLERVLESPDFDGSPRSRAFLRHIVEETLAGRQASLTQPAIAIRVFSRRESFDPTIDPIVRIQAGRLRRSLERYYLTSGCEDAVRLELPRGTYVPSIGWASSPSRTVSTAPDADGWPTVVVGPFDDETPGHSGFGRVWHFRNHLAVELGRWGDVRVVPLEPGAPVPAGDRSFLLRGHLCAEGDLARLTARLVRCRDGRQVWADDYRKEAAAGDAAVEELAGLVAARIASESGVVATTLLADVGQGPPPARASYDAILLGYRGLLLRRPGDVRSAIEALQAAVLARPECGLAWTELARHCAANHAFDASPLPTPVHETVAFAQNAVRLDPSSMRAAVMLAWALFLKGEHEASRAELEQLLALAPDSFVHRESCGWLLTLLGDWERGPALVRDTLTRNPRAGAISAHALWLDHLRRGQFEAAHQSALMCRDGFYFWRALMRACCLGHLGRRGEARRERDALLAIRPDFPRKARTLVSRVVTFPDLQDKVLAGLHKAGLVLNGAPAGRR